MRRFFWAGLALAITVHHQAAAQTLRIALQADLDTMDPTLSTKIGRAHV